MTRIDRTLVAAALVGFALAGCGGAPAKPTCTTPSLSGLLVEAHERVNVDPAGRSLPTVVRVYQLADVANLETASFEDVWSAPEETLGEDLLDATEVTVFPGRRVDRPLERHPDARYVVGVGIFREPAGRTWQSVLALPRDQAGCAPPEEGETPEARVVVHLEGSRITSRSEVLGDEVIPMNDALPDLPEEDLRAPEEPDPDLPEADVSGPVLPSTPTPPEAPSAPGSI